MDFSTSAAELMDGFSQLNLEAGQDPIFGLSPEPVPKRLWNDVLKLLVTGESDWESLDEEDKLSLAYYDDKNVSRPTLLHKLTEDPSLMGFEELAIETRENIILFLLNQLSRHAERPADPLLTVAISYHRGDFIEFILTKQSDLLPSLLLSTDGEGKNCLHKAFQSVLLSDWGAHQKRASGDLTSTMSTITTLLEHANLTTTTAQDNSGNTPIHYAMDYRLCHISATYEYGGKTHGYDEIIRKLLSPLAKNNSVLKNVDVLFNRIGDSPYRYYFRLKDQIHERLKQIMKANAPGSSGKEPKPNAKQTMKEDHHDLVKGPEKHPTGESVDRLSISMKKDFLQTTLSVKTYVRPVLTGPQHRLGSSATPPDKAKDSEAGQAKLYPLARTPTGFADTIRRKVQPKTSPETTTSSIPTNQEASKSGRTVEPFQWPRLETEAAEKLLNYVQCFFIRNCTDRDAKDFLYGRVASDKNLFFDASHLRGKRVDDVVLLIEKLHQAGGFGDTLSYVRIPQLASEIPAIPPTQRRNFANEKRQLTKGSADSASKGRDTLVKVFDKLVEVHVRKVLRLHVEDNADERAHTDAAIERAIRGYDQYSSAGSRTALEIEEWDWCKPDINTDVIKHAAPSVQHIHLHWSGNQAVLYGWASSEHGIPLIWRNPRSLLSNVTLHAYQGLESMERRDVMADQFASLVEKRTDKKVKVTPNPVLRSIIVKERPDGEQDPLYGGQFEKPRSDAWIGAMERFRKALLGMHKSGLLGQPSSQPSRVKVALIDDGIDLHEVNHYNNTTSYTGVSYCPSNGRGEDAWWKSTGGHGTIMANMISRINPWVDLEVIKIQSSPSYIHGNGARSIDPRSAADAIDAAIKRKADIISMSWTITDLGYRRSSIYSESPDVEGTKKPAGQIEMDLLREAIERATKNPMERLLICSAADDLRLSGKNTLPYSAASKRILRIGSAGHFADRDPSSGSGNSITFYFPGNQVAEEQRAHSTNPVVYHTGSSVSTALAAGLASLIMYCAHCVHACGAGDEYRSFALSLRDFSCMKDAFSAINRHSKWDDDQKIVPVWGLFGEKADEILADGKTDREKIIVLKNLVKYLCHKLIPETS